MEISKVNSDLHSILLSVKERTKIETRVATVCKITKVDETNKRLNAKPIIKEKYITKTGKTEYVELPELLNIPYLSILGVPTVNEYCVVIHLDRSLNGVDLTKEPTTVESIGNIHNISDGIALFGFKETAVNPGNIAERLDNLDNAVIDLDEKIKANTEAIATKQDKLTFDTEPTENSTNPVTSNGIYQRTRPHIETVATNASWNTTSHTHTTGVVDPSLGFPRFLVFSSKAKSSPNNEQSMRMYPLNFLKIHNAVEMDCRDAWAGFKDIKLTYTDNKYILHFNIRGQSGWSDDKTLNIYLVW